MESARGLQDVKLALENHKSVIAAIFHNQSTWPAENDLVQLLTDCNNRVLLIDLSTGSGAALSHQYDQGQVAELITSCKEILYGTGDIHPREPPGSPDSSPVRIDSREESSLGDPPFSATVPEIKKETEQKKPYTVHFSDEKMESKPKLEEKEETKQIKRMAASAVAAAVAGATAQHISKSNKSPAGIKAATAAAEVAQAVVDGNSDAAAQAVVRVAKIVEDETNVSRRAVQNGATTSPPKSTTCILL